METVIKDTKEKMDKAIQAYSRQLATVRAGRANPAILDSVQVEYYGSLTPLKQLATVTAPEARMLLITPFDKTAINDMERSILKADLGLTPSNDGNVIRINIPPLTEERRKELVKVVRKYAEEAKVVIRNIRRDSNDELKKLEKDGELTEDELRGYQDDVQKETDNFIKKIDELTKTKEEEVLAV